MGHTRRPALRIPFLPVLPVLVLLVPLAGIPDAGADTITDTTQGNFLAGTNGGVDLLTVPDSITLPREPTFWARNAGNPVLSPGTLGAWDDGSVNEPTVVKNGSSYQMWYVGQNASNATNQFGYASSISGITWGKPQASPVFWPAGGSAFDSAQVYGPSVILDGGVYRMWYQGYDGSATRIGYATSADGLSWTRWAGSPVLDVGSGGGWESAGVGSPFVLKDGATLKMWYTGYDGTTRSIGYATSSDGTSWTRHPANPVLQPGGAGAWDDDRVVAAAVVKDGATYRMWYSGSDGAQSRIGYATSTDGTTWTRHPANPALALGAPSAWDRQDVEAAGILVDGNLFRMYYGGSDGTTRRLGLATGEYPANGTFTSRVLDAGGTGSTFQRLYFNAILPPSTGISFRTASGDTPVRDAGWSPWSAPITTPGAAVSSPRHRYLQYEALLATSDPTRAPVIDDITIEFERNGAYPPVPTGPDPAVWQRTSTPAFRWFYDDPEGDPQQALQIQVAPDTTYASFLMDATANTTATSMTGGALPDGVWSLRMRSQDSQGLWSPWSASTGVRIDTTPPANPAAITSPTHALDRWSDSSVVTVSWSGADDAVSRVAGFAVLWDTLPGAVPEPNQTASASTSSDVSPSMPEGGGTFVHIRTVDTAGNWNASAASLGPFLIDLTPPEATEIAIEGDAATTGQLLVNVTVTGTDSLSGVEAVAYLVDGGAWSAWSRVAGPGPAYTFAVELPDSDGTHAVTARLRNGAGIAGNPVTDEILLDHSPAVPPNRPPVLDPIPQQAAVEGSTFRLNITARDPEGDPVTFALAKSPAGMEIQASSGRITWSPTAAQAAKFHPVVVTARDTAKAETSATFSVKVLARPEVSILAPAAGSVVQSGTVGIRGKASVRDSTIAGVEITIGNEKPRPAFVRPDGAWSYTWDSSRRTATSVTITAVARSASGVSSAPASSTVTISAGPGPGGGLAVRNPLLLAGLLGAIVAIAAVAFVLARRRRAGVAGVGAASTGAAGWPTPGPAGPGAATSTSTTAGETAAVAAPPTGGDIEPFAVTEVLLIYGDGRLLAQTTSEEGEGLDKTLMASMLIAIQNFVRESFRTAGGLNTFSFDRYTVVVEGSPHLFVAVVVEGSPPAGLRDEVEAVLERIEGLYTGVLDGWDGNSAPFADVRGHLAPLFAYHRRFTFKATAPSVRMRSALEFFQGYVRLKVAVTNETRHVVTDATLQLIYNRQTLRLERVEPAVVREGSTVTVGTIRPREKTTVAFYLDPLICQESTVEGSLSYHDHEGNLLHVDMKRRPVDVVCPIFYTPRTVSVAMLRQLIANATEKDVRIYRIPDAIRVEDAFRAAKETIQAHDVRFVREFEERSPAHVVEAWHFGKVKVTGEEIVIRTTARSDTGTLEVFVACNNLSSMTGLLAELGHQVGQALTGVTVSTDESMRDILAKTVLLLDKYGEFGQAEAPPAE